MAARTARYRPGARLREARVAFSREHRLSEGQWRRRLSREALIPLSSRGASDGAMGIEIVFGAGSGCGGLPGRSLLGGEPTQKSTPAAARTGAGVR